MNVSLLIVRSNWALFVAGSEQDPSVWPEGKALKGNCENNDEQDVHFVASSLTEHSSHVEWQNFVTTQRCPSSVYPLGQSFTHKGETGSLK